jgi:hypothetical protein
LAPILRSLSSDSSLLPSKPVERAADEMHFSSLVEKNTFGSETPKKTRIWKEENEKPLI